MTTERRDTSSGRDWRHIDQNALWHPFTQMSEYQREDPPPPIIVSAEGNWLIAQDGKRYLDANCGYWCLALGCRPESVERAVKAQLDRFAHSTLLGLSHEPAIALAERLTKLAGPPLNHVFFNDSGSEAVEAALKMAYQYQVHQGHPERCEFLGLGEAYHGDTLGAVAVSGVDLFHATFKPLLFKVQRVAPPHCYRCPFDRKPDTCALECAQAMENAIAERASTLAAVIVEPFVLGPGGIIPQPANYLERVTQAARRHGVTLIFDEVAVGMGRLGSVFAFEQLTNRNVDFKPDIVCCAKGLTAGVLPLSAVLVNDTIYDAFKGTIAERKTFFHGHTFTGSALGCAAALAALDVIASGDFLQTLRDVTIPAFWRALEPLRAHPHVGNLRGRGMMAGLEVVKSRGAKDESYPWHERYGHRVVLAARKRGVNVRAIGDLLLAVPPLTVTLEEIRLLASVLSESLDEATA
ncbi:MAG TPA: adenosylmethionine--8-amino-7-oxononanoate transaminase [Planctomycetota bacterium]|nr:adenosylmethionine--8-amino-7-oxononanoate transaminase [Planctomycetota bacterium]